MRLLASGIGSDFAQTVLTGPVLLAAGAAALAGMVSFLSPCVLPLVPGYVGYVTGLSGTSLREKTTWKVVVGTSLFILGFTVIFVLLGTLMSYLGAVFSHWEDIIIRILGVVVIIAGFIFMGGFGLLQRNRQIRAKPKAGLWGAPLLGGVFPSEVVQAPSESRRQGRRHHPDDPRRRHGQRSVDPVAEQSAGLGRRFRRHHLRPVG